MRRSFAQSLSHDRAIRARFVILGCVLAGLALRLALLIHAGWRYDYDEGMVGLQVLRIMRGEHPVFHPGHPYLGALESYLTVPLFRLFGANAVTLKLISWLLSGAYVGATGWLGERVFERQVGALSALLAALAPPYLLIVGMKTWGATAETLVLGNVALIATTYAVDGSRSAPDRARALVLLGLIAGVAFWISWLFAFYALPVAVVLFWRGRDVPRWAWLGAALAFGAGSAPFWIYNVEHPLATFRYFFDGPDTFHATTAQVLDHMVNDLGPRLVSGDPLWRRLSWPAIWWLQAVYEGGAALLVLWAVRGRWNAAQRPARLLLALFALGAPVIYVASGWGNRAINAFGFDATGRYLLVLHSVMPIGAAAAAVALGRWRHWMRPLGAAVAASVIVLNLLGAVRADPVKAFTSPYYMRQPVTLEPLIAFLDRQGITAVWTDVGVAHVLMFETHERILAADWYDIYAAKGLLRFPDVPVEIAQADRVAFVEVILPGQTDTHIERAFDASGVPYAVTRVAPDLLVIVPFAPVDPAILGDGLGYQF
jgi:hypothetical protein